jgi:hypothetical protein
MALFACRPCQRNRLAVITLIALTIGGCGRARSEGTVSGHVQVDGKPLPGGSVTFIPTEPGANSVTAEIDQSGHFGPVVLPAGEVMVTVDNRTLAPKPAKAPIPLPKGLSAEARAKINVGREAGPAPRPNPNYVLIPTRYHMAETCEELRFTVAPGEQTHDIALISK